MNIAKGIRERRQILKLSEQELANTVGVTRQHISAIEQGKAFPSLVVLAKLAEELGVSVDYLVIGKEGMIMDAIPAIKANKKLSLKAKKALIALIQELYETEGKK